jgi:hypothetical protein
MFRLLSATMGCGPGAPTRVRFECIEDPSRALDRLVPPEWDRVLLGLHAARVTPGPLSCLSICPEGSHWVQH